MENEVWVDIKGFEGRHMISNLGRVKSLPRNGTIKTEKIMSQHINRYGYPAIGLKRNILSKQAYVIHRLVAKSFIPNPENKETVNHINGIKTDNRVENIEWCTFQENTSHATKNDLYNSGRDNHNSKVIIQLDLLGNEIKRWDCISRASKELKIQRPNISHCLLKNRHKAGGFKWEYAS